MWVAEGKRLTMALVFCSATGAFGGDDHGIALLDQIDGLGDDAGAIGDIALDDGQIPGFTHEGPGDGDIEITRLCDEK